MTPADIRLPVSFPELLAMRRTLAELTQLLGAVDVAPGASHARLKGARTLTANLTKRLTDILREMPPP